MVDNRLGKISFFCLIDFKRSAVRKSAADAFLCIEIGWRLQLAVSSRISVLWNIIVILLTDFVTLNVIGNRTGLLVHTTSKWWVGGKHYSCSHNPDTAII